MFFNWSCQTYTRVKSTDYTSPPFSCSTILPISFDIILFFFLAGVFYSKFSTWSEASHEIFKVKQPSDIGAARGAVLELGSQGILDGSRLGTGRHGGSVTSFTS